MGVKRLAGTFAGLALVAASLVLGSSGTASACVIDADGDCFLHVTGTVTSANLNVRAAPWGTVLDNVPNGYSSDVTCYVQASDGSYWDWLYDTRIGRSGWVYDPYLYTGGNIYQQVDEMHEGNCGSIPLAMPGNVTATAISTGAIRVTWSDTNAGSAQYVVSNGNVSSPDLAAGSTSYTWGGLAPNTYMCFTVAAKESGQQSPWTAYACTSTWALRAPSTVTATPVSTTAIRVTWNDPNGGASQFVVSNGNVSSADLAAGSTSYTWSGLSPGTYMCFTIAAKQSGQQSAWSQYGCTTTPIFVNMGDSFSSGEGTFGPYDSPTNTPNVNMCHQSPNSYSGQYAAMSTVWNKVTNVACTGAVTEDISVDPTSPNAMNIPDKGQKAQYKYLNSKVRLVTLTIGGNDLNLAGIVGTCLKDFINSQNGTNKCMIGGDEPKIQGFDNNFISGIQNALVSSLKTAYAKIHSAAPNALIVVSTYPQIFPATYPGACPEFIPPLQLWLITSQNEWQRFREVTSNLNAAIKTAAAQSTDVVVFDASNVFSGHELCTAHPWVNAVKGYINTSGTYDDESLHPTTTGYYHWALALKSFLGE